MSTSSKEQELAAEQTAQRLYSRELQARSQAPRRLEGPANGIWTGTVRPPRGVLPDGQLIGRVALANSDPDLDGGSDFYIGETRANFDGTHVFSWAAPVACTFFRGSRHHEWCDEVTAVRAFVLRGGTIVDFAEEVVHGDASADPFRKRGLTVPAAQQATRRALPGSAGKQPVPQSRTAPLSVGAAQGTIERIRALRAETLLMKQLQAPRTKSLVPVLATLQPDQYDMVTLPTKGRSVIIEGQPGTGKTIIASHRAAYLVNEDTLTESTFDGNVLLVGPTDGYTRHVGDVVDRLTGGTDRVKILSLPRLMRNILGVKGEPNGPLSNNFRDADSYLGMLARKAIFHLKSLNGVAMKPEGAYELLRQNGLARHPLESDPLWISYLQRLPPYKEAVRLRAHLPLLALIKWEMTKSDELRSIEHIIVDEAQDVTPLEWLLLSAINRTDAWTILGDLNQRRSDHTLASWQQVREVLGLRQKEAPARSLQRGYRSTKPILEYANRLLPRRERALLAFQTEGPAPSITKVPAKDLRSAIVSQVNRLLQAYPAGTVAVISAYPATAGTALRMAGWATARPGRPTWERNGQSVTVLHPDDARGLEFDAVIVVEPTDFPQNYGRQGPLYTALTRPNRELAIVHTKPLPETLQRH